MPKKIECCRICCNEHLVEVCDLGEQALTGIFPKSESQSVTVGPLRLTKCVGDPDHVCGLLQLAHSYELTELYGSNYGYRSGLNPSMVRHLQQKVSRILSIAPLRAGDLVIDIGSNDGTTLSAYPPGQYTLVGIDPTGQKFRQYYPPHVELQPDFFSAGLVQKRYPGHRARVITSFSMFYDLEEPLTFMREVLEVLADDGIWVFEQSYMPTMLATNSYDTVCHEHLEYYGLRQVKWMADRADAKIVDVEFNDVNGGSFSVTLAKRGSSYEEFNKLPDLLTNERELGLDGLRPYSAFAADTIRLRSEFQNFLEQARRDGKRVAALGASTKGNVVLQYCDVTAQQIECVGEVNPDKFGSYTPGTLLPIVSEDELLASRPDYLVVLPWHFRKFFETSPKFAGMCLVFPLPKLTFVQR
jgi:NDP-4-keto-2,6-dideoxyhexose 3-C-methyltransferase